LQERPAQIRLTQRRGTALINMAVAALIIIALYLGREIFVPVALSVLLSFVLAPFVIRLNSLRIPRTASVLIVVFFGFAIIFSLGGLMVSQATRLAAKLPGYQQTLSDKVESLRGLMGVLERWNRRPPFSRNCGPSFNMVRRPASPTMGSRDKHPIRRFRYPLKSGSPTPAL